MRPGGSLILNSSVVGLTSDPGICAYATSKHALVGLMRTAAKEVAEPRDPRQQHPSRARRQRLPAPIETVATGEPEGRAAAIFEAMIPARAPRHAGGGGSARALPRLRRERVHDRGDDPARRRDERLSAQPRARAPRVAAPSCGGRPARHRAARARTGGAQRAPGPRAAASAAPSQRRGIRMPTPAQSTRAAFSFMSPADRADDDRAAARRARARACRGRRGARRRRTAASSCA